jgi:hypothetical protein
VLRRGRCRGVADHGRRDAQYFFTKAGADLQYKFNRDGYDRGLESAKLGGEVAFQGLQVYLSLRF